jgi:ribonucleotide reductase alpha subunit
MLAPDLWLANQAYLKSIGVENGINNVNNGSNPINIYSGRYNFDELRSDVVKYGLYCSLHVAPMPTVSTSQILDNTESFEPMSACIYTKKTISGKYIIANDYMVGHLMKLGLWNEKIRMQVLNTGSVQHIAEIPPEIREIYLNVYEVKQADLMRRASIRQAFIDQSQSLNTHLTNNSNSYLRGVFFNGWKLGLKTGSYYIRTKSAASSMKNNIAQEKKANVKTVMTGDSLITCTDEVCTSCSS